MDTTYVFIAVIAACILAAAVAMARKKPKEEDTAANPEEQQGDQELYQLGMTPISDKPIMYALTTCLHCKNTRKYLDEEHVEYISIFVDEYVGKQRSDLMDKVRMYNPRATFPTIVMPNGKVIVGYRKQLLQEALSNAAGRTA